MKSLLTVVLSLGLLGVKLQAYPPAPHHLIYGIVRDELGVRLDAGLAEIILETGSGQTFRSGVSAPDEKGNNYQITIPMDSGITGETYQPTAMRPWAPFRIKVRIGSTMYVPIEMTGDYAKLGQPGETTRINLTLGEDVDGDGLPDAWERLIAARTGRNPDLKSIRPDDDSDGDGLSNLQEYLAGTYAFDAKDGLSLIIIESDGVNATVEFIAIRGREYSIVASNDLRDWARVQFRLSGSGLDQNSFLADDVRKVRCELALPERLARARFFKLLVQ